MAASSRSSSDPPLDGELRVCSRERSLEHDHFLDASAALEKRGPHGDEDGETAGRETDERAAMTIEPTHGNPAGGRRFLHNRG